VLSALITDGTSLLPKSEKVNDKTGIFRAGCLGNILIGAIATVVSSGLQGQISVHYNMDRHENQP